MDATGNHFEGTSSYGKERLALEELKKIAIEARVNLEGVAAVFDDVGVDKTRDAALTKEGLAEGLRERPCDVECRRFGFRQHASFYSSRCREHIRSGRGGLQNMEIEKMGPGRQAQPLQEVYD